VPRSTVSRTVTPGIAPALFLQHFFGPSLEDAGAPPHHRDGIPHQTGTGCTLCLFMKEIFKTVSIPGRWLALDWAPSRPSKASLHRIARHDGQLLLSPGLNSEKALVYLRVAAEREGTIETPLEWWDALSFLETPSVKPSRPAKR